MNNWKIEQIVELRNPAQRPSRWASVLMLEGDCCGHDWRITVLDGAAPADLVGYGVVGYFQRSDGHTVVVPGTIEGNVCIVTLPQACYAVRGQMRCVMRLSTAGETVTLAVMFCNVDTDVGDELIDPGIAFPDLTELMAQIQVIESATTAAVKATANANAAAVDANSAAVDANAAANRANEQLEDLEKYVDGIAKVQYKMGEYTHISRMYLHGDVTAMSKDNAVCMAYRYEGATNYINDGNNSGKRENGIIYSGHAKVKWQGSSSIAFPKKNYTITLYSDEVCETKQEVELREAWGSQSKYCMKANFIDPTHCRNVVAARLWAKCVLSRPNDCESYIRMNGLPNAGAIDGYPVLVFINDEYVGIYTMNIPKDDWMFGMTDGEGTNVVLCGENHNDATRFNAPSVIDGTDWDYEVKPADKSWVLNSFNAIYNALALPETTENEIATKKTALEACLDVYSVIDYSVFLNKLGLTDNLGKNQLMVTYDGVKWIISAYDLDTAFGLVWSGAKYSPATRVINSNNLTDVILRLYGAEYEDRKNTIDSLLSKAAISDALMNFAIDIPQEAFMLEAKLWPDMAGANMNGMNQIQDFLNYREDESGGNVPKPTAADAGKFLRVNSAGAYILETVSNAEEVGF